MSNNWYIYSRAQNIFLVVVGAITCAAAVFVATFVILAFLKMVLQRSKRRIDWNNWTDLLIIGLSLSLCVILFRNTLAAIHLSPVITIPLVAVFVIVAR